MRLATSARSDQGFQGGDGDGWTDLVLATFAGVDVFLQRDGSLVRTGLIDVPQAQQVSLVKLDGDADLDPVVQRAGERTSCVRLPGIDPTGIGAGVGHTVAITARGR